LTVKTGVAIQTGFTVRTVKTDLSVLENISNVKFFNSKSQKIPTPQISLKNDKAQKGCNL
jgi:hypothetical protein